MGSQSNIDLAYIAGFLDGDGSLMLQIKKRGDGKRKWRIMCTICFYQDGRHESPLYWIRKKLGIGYVSKRNDGMSELRINGFKQVRDILNNLIPFIKFKKEQAKSMHYALEILLNNDQPNNSQWRKLVDCILKIQENNYVTKKKKTREELCLMLGLTP